MECNSYALTEVVNEKKDFNAFFLVKKMGCGIPFVSISYILVKNL